ncbi:cAMP-binding protein [Flavobacterium noncentrifugens]|uniref:cAMP-binding domain of CRP or a regulatory subunit of cAMP-dependent protein kinases n=1 Tax=Flavobacterium noncentrifugens TaxID=1128970 RepID=A0A1G8UQI6_9FLAO|nr:Crp/Fnr family transcriptional regulator [Flavobacterium noncentrifugens]GEP52608.1 cAMP-binding protein [Flavobacterium noncentrifugens]SDJ56146.1 cAMP-binding domain of CRP or a regulatory subunit of cAMP-dependent protein kinases [Flavobacterium noncentrifugens]
MIYDILFKHLEQKIQLSEVEKEIVKSYFIPKTLKKRKLLLQEGYVCKYLTFVASGLLKTYHIDEKGKEHISQFTPEGWWTSDMHSFFHSVPSQYTIDALEDSELLMITAEDFENMTLQVPVMDRYFRLLFQNSLVVKERRLVTAHTLTAEEKYRQLVENNPGLVNRVPQNLLASYLGLTAATVSRLKKNV